MKKPMVLLAAAALTLALLPASSLAKGRTPSQTPANCCAPKAQSCCAVTTANTAPGCCKKPAAPAACKSACAKKACKTKCDSGKMCAPCKCK